MNEHFSSGTESETEFNDKINSVILRRLRSRAMNESPISMGATQVCVFARAPVHARATTGVYLASSRCQTGSQPCVCGEIR